MALGLIALFWPLIQNAWVKVFGSKSALSAAE
jgi:hypothetical protein